MWSIWEETRVYGKKPLNNQWCCVDAGNGAAASSMLQMVLPGGHAYCKEYLAHANKVLVEFVTGFISH